MTVIKANAYGHGIIEVAKALSDVDSLAVARLGEAKSLRAAGIDTPVVILEGVFDAVDLTEAVAANCELVVHCIEQLELLERCESGSVVAWLKFDTGMNRLGFPVSNAGVLIDRAKNCGAIGELRLMSHFANADDREDDTTTMQLNQFRSIADGFDGDISIANSPGLFAWPDTVRVGSRAGDTWIRPGIALYGISPFNESTGADLGLQAVMQFRSQLIVIKAISAGDRVGYGGTWEAKEDTMIGIISAGYGDGYSRLIPSGTPVIINDRRVPIAGRVSMDMITVDLGPGCGDRPGDSVLLWGDGLPVEEIAEAAGTIPYQLVCGVLDREASEYLD
jgi:alanine racemase